MSDGRDGWALERSLLLSLMSAGRVYRKGAEAAKGRNAETMKGGFGFRRSGLIRVNPCHLSRSLDKVLGFVRCAPIVVEELLKITDHGWHDPPG